MLLSFYCYFFTIVNVNTFDRLSHSLTVEIIVETVTNGGCLLYVCNACSFSTEFVAIVEGEHCLGTEGQIYVHISLVHAESQFTFGLELSRLCHFIKLVVGKIEVGLPVFRCCCQAFVVHSYGLHYVDACVIVHVVLADTVVKTSGQMSVNGLEHHACIGRNIEPVLVLGAV